MSNSKETSAIGYIIGIIGLVIVLLLLLCTSCKQPFHYYKYDKNIGLYCSTVDSTDCIQIKPNRIY